MFTKGQRVIIKSGPLVGKIGIIVDSDFDNNGNIYIVSFDGLNNDFFFEDNVELYFDKRLRDIIDE